MDQNLKKVWTEIIQATDLDSHMAQIGQAEANASLVMEMLRSKPLQSKSQLGIVGCGTGQIFEFIDLNLFEKLSMTLSDINSSFLEKTNARLSKCNNLKFKTVIDDIEETNLSDSFDAVLIVLVLEHVDWKKAIDAITTLKPKTIYLIIQAQEAGHSMVATKRELRPSIQKFTETAKAHLIDRTELIQYLGDQHFILLETFEKNVPDHKKMVALIFGENE